MALQLMNDEQFQCCICLDVFNNPVSLACGHNFCHTCINGYWDTAAVCQCPLCKRAYFIRPEVAVNTIMKDLVEEFKKMRAPNSDAAKPGEVLSEVQCSEDGQGELCAPKSCLDCSVHVECCQRVPGFQKHTFKEPLKNSVENTCKKHRPQLKSFCGDDNNCASKFSMEGEHKNNNMVPLDEEGDEKSTPPVCSVDVEFHQKVPGFQRDTLAEPMKSPEASMCKKHRPTLKIFCGDSNNCVHKFCMEEEHKNNNMAPLDKENKVKKNAAVSVSFSKTRDQAQNADQQSTLPCINACLSKNKNLCKEGLGSHDGHHKPPLLPMSQSPTPPYPVGVLSPMDMTPSPPPPGFTCMMYYPPSLPPPMPMPEIPPFGMQLYTYPPPHSQPFPYPVLPHSPIPEKKDHP